MRTASGPAPYSKATNRPLKKFSLPDLTPSRSSSVMGRPGHPVGRVGPLAATDRAPTMVRRIRPVRLDFREQGQGKALR
jgi:hypothetical protein